MGDFIMNEYDPDYSEDYYCWLMSMAHLLNQGDLDCISSQNIEFLVDEIKSIARMEYNDIQERLKNLLVELILYNYVSLQDKPVKYSIIQERGKLGDILMGNKSLKVLLYSLLQESYSSACNTVYVQKDVSPQALKLPDECPFSLEQVFDHDFFEHAQS
jgi:hypothetical protein